MRGFTSHPSMDVSPNQLMKFVAYIRVASISFALLVTACASTPEKVDTSLGNFRSATETARFFENAHGYAIFPTIGKAAIGVGGAHGNGTVFRGGEAIGEVRVTALSAGLQFGGQSFSQLIFFEDPRALTEFCSGQFEFGANASAVVVVLGATATAASTGVSASSSTDQEHAHLASRYYKGMAVFTLAKGGLMYEAALGGQKFTAECAL